MVVNCVLNVSLIVLKCVKTDVISVVCWTGINVSTVVAIFWPVVEVTTGGVPVPEMGVTV